MTARSALIAILLAAAPASARTIARTSDLPERVDKIATIGIESGATVAATELVVHDAGASSVATLTLTLTADQLMAASTMLALPAGAKVVGMTLAHGDQQFVARPLEMIEAQERFSGEVEPPRELVVPRAPTKRDPALLQLDDGGARLTVFPISPDSPATVTLQVAMPHADRTRVMVSGHATREIASSAGTAEDVVLAASTSPLTADHVLYAAPLSPAPSVEVLASTLAGVHGTLERCAAVDSPDTVLHVTLEVAVDAQGHAWLNDADGANGSLTDCLRQAVENMRLGDDAATKLAYDLTVVGRRTDTVARR